MTNATDERTLRRRARTALRNRRYRRRKKIEQRHASRHGFISDYEAVIRSIVARRKALGLSQLAVDQMSGLPDGYQGKIECGLRSPSLQTLSTVLQALGLGMVLVPGEAPRFVKAARRKRRPKRHAEAIGEATP